LSSTASTAGAAAQAIAIVGAIVALAGLGALTACRSKPSAGTACRVPDQLVCAGSGRALVCDSATASAAASGSGPATASPVWVDVPCLGARGCTHHSEADDCDDTIAADGDRCPRNPPLDYACTADRTRALVCKDGRFTLWRDCRGPDGCQIVDGRNVHCDTTLGQPGDPCAQQGTYACAVDKQTMLVCDGNTLQAASSCRGPGGCNVHPDTRKVDCDDAVALEGDSCDQPKRIACAVDRKSELVCTDRKYVKKRDCRRGDCRLDGNELFCD
jgi:hypothetical protein